MEIYIVPPIILPIIPRSTLIFPLVALLKFGEIRPTPKMTVQSMRLVCIG